jgi:hypothetical protein
MSNQRPSFAKRDREMKLKDKARQKAERRAARRSEVRTGHGPPIAADESPDTTPTSDDSPAATTAPVAGTQQPRPR